MAIPLVLLMADLPEGEPRRFAVGVEGELAPTMATDVGQVSIPLPSLAFTYAFRRPWALQLLVGGAWASTTTDVPTQSRTQQVGITSSVRAIAWPLQLDRARLGIVVQAGYRGAYGGEDAELQTLRLRRHGFVAAAGLRPEFFIVPRLSLHTQLGVAYVFEDDNTTQTTQSFRFAGQVLGQAGLSVWF